MLRPNNNPNLPPHLARKRLLLARMLTADDARESLLTFARFTSPDPDDVDDPTRSAYVVARHHARMAQELQELAEGKTRRLILSLPPRHGKTELASKKFIPWLIGRNPANSFIFGTYNAAYSRDIGQSVRDTVVTPEYLQVFPDMAPVARVKPAVVRIAIPQNLGGGMAVFVGRGGAITGRGGDFIILDDPLKDADEARSPTIRDRLWQWWQRTVRSRAMTDQARVVLIQTRWHPDDLVGRLTDPSNDHYDATEAKQWRVVNLAALADRDDPLGRAPGEALWPERFGADYLRNLRSTDPRGFAALYQGRPVADGGNLIHESWLRTYQERDLPPELRLYAASDHAVAVGQARDRTVIMLAGVDAEENIWILPELFWARADTNAAVNHMIDVIRRRKPIMWWAERSIITKSIGPFLRAEMQKHQAFVPIVEITVSGDKQSRAQSILGRMAQGRVRFPSFAPWWGEAKQELLSFPGGTHDDFVDALGYLGLGLGQMVAADRPQAPRTSGAFTMGWLRERDRWHASEARAMAMVEEI